MEKQEFEAIIKLLPGKRYIYFIKRICDWDEIWTLYEDDYLILNEDEKGKKYIYLFPFEEFASYFVEKEEGMQGYSCKSISLEKFIDETFGKLLAKNIKDAFVFPVPQGYGLNISLEELKKDIEQELENYS